MRLVFKSSVAAEDEGSLKSIRVDLSKLDAAKVSEEIQKFQTENQSHVWMPRYAPLKLVDGKRTEKERYASLKWVVGEEPDVQELIDSEQKRLCIVMVPLDDPNAAWTATATTSKTAGMTD